MRRRIVSPKLVTPPDGVWRFAVGDDMVESPLYEDLLRRADALLRKHGIEANAVDEVAKYMCPLLPPGQCTGEGASSPVIYARDAAEAARPYFSRDVEPADVIQARMECCTRCARHRRDFCLHCTGYDAWVYSMFRARRPKLPADDASGCCTCARTMEAVIASVHYAKDEPVWEGVPDTCWRHSP